MTIPAITIPAVTIPAVTIPGYAIPARCFDTDETEAPPPSETTVRVRSYNRIDSQFSLALSIAYWRQTGNSSSVPSHAARGFGEVNAAGHVKNQYVLADLRSNGTFVPGHGDTATPTANPPARSSAASAGSTTPNATTGARRLQIG